MCLKMPSKKILMLRVYCEIKVGKNRENFYSRNWKKTHSRERKKEENVVNAVFAKELNNITRLGERNDWKKHAVKNTER